VAMPADTSPRILRAAVASPLQSPFAWWIASDLMGANPMAVLLARAKGIELHHRLRQYRSERAQEMSLGLHRVHASGRARGDEATASGRARSSATVN